MDALKQVICAEIFASFNFPFTKTIHQQENSEIDFNIAFLSNPSLAEESTAALCSTMELGK